MALVLIKETGAGLSDANSYASAADGDAYHDGHLYASSWTAAVTGSKEKALVMATRLIDGLFQFDGFKRLSAQALQWPRRECRDPDIETGVIPGLLLVRGPYLDETKVPVVVMNATCELARALLVEDRTDNPDGEGLSSMSVVGSLRLDFNAHDRQPVIPAIVQTWLGKFGQYLPRTRGTAKLVRT